MNLTGHSFIGNSRSTESSDTFTATNATTGEALEPTFYSATTDDLEKAVSLATVAFQTYSKIEPKTRAKFLRTIAEKINAAGPDITPRMMAESGLPEPRCEGERGRTVGQLNMFADLIEEGSWVDARIETAQPDRAPIPKPDLRSMRRPLGPVAVFCASNFPLAFSVAGGDTASALAAGCPVIVRAHSAHAGTAEIVASAIQTAVAECEMPEGTFSMIFDSGIELGTALVTHPGIKAVGFTGSRAGGRALMDAAAARPEPIPVFAEMSSVNPVFILPGAMAERGEAIAQGLVGSVTLGAGQFCTCPGLVFGNTSEAFESTLQAGFSEAAPATMLHGGILDNFANGLKKLRGQSGVDTLAEGSPAATHKACPAILKASANDFTSNPELSAEVFGPSSLVIECGSQEDMIKAARSLEGQLTATVHGTDEEIANAGELLQILEQKAGRVIINGFPTGVEVNSSMVHGGPYPATSDGASTSVGTGAILRYTRPVSFQGFPDSALPAELQNGNPRGIARLVNGKLEC
ncbi:MAG: aldehyde dehydrogenase (NADP(+)) [Akkermansiaceae bacterium]|nr:aldehyde dehydrogenase (NADP(+)) [Akkermansiaceae bacterium]